MKVLFLCHFFPPTHTSGAENYTFNLAQALVQRGHQVHVLCAGTWDTGKRYWNGFTDEIVGGIAVRRIHLCWYKAPDPNRYLHDNPVTAEHLQGWLREIQPDIVHITSCYTLSARIIQVCKDSGIPVIITLVDFWFLCPSLHLLRSNGELCDGLTTPWDCLKCMTYRSKAYQWPAKLLPEEIVERLLIGASKLALLSGLRGLRGMALNMEERKRFVADQLRQADVILAPSQFLASVHTAVIHDLFVQIQPYGHDLSWLSDYSERSSSAALRFCYMGQIDPDKGVHILVEAFLRLGAVPDLTLDIWGSLDNGSRYTTHIQELVAQSGNIRLCGRFARSQLGDVLANADVVVVPSIWYENNPLVIQEAFAARVPVIATNLGGMAEFVTNEVNGLLFENGNVDDLVLQMRRIIQEPTLLTRLQVGIPPVPTVEQVVVELMTIYDHLSEPQSYD